MLLLIYDKLIHKLKDKLNVLMMYHLINELKYVFLSINCIYLIYRIKVGSFCL